MFQLVDKNMENYYLIMLSLFLVLSAGITRASTNIKTFYDTDFETSNLFDDASSYDEKNVNKLCNRFGEFYEEMNEKNVLPKCIRFKNSQTLYCHGEMENFRNYTNKPKLERIENLVVCYHNTTEFDVNLLKYFAKLKCFFIGYSSFEKFVGKIPHLEHLKFINVTHTDLKVIRSDFVSQLPSIRGIDLRSNQLNIIEKLHLSADHEGPVKLYLQYNLWNCSKSKIIKWIAINDSKYDFADRKKLNCSDSKFSKRPLMSVMRYKMDLTRLCKEELGDLKNCSCHISYLRFDVDSHQFKPVASINCSSKGFYNFPERLPPYTNALFFEHNHVTSLDALCFKNSTYTNVHDIYLDYNQINDAAVLDNCAWFEGFRVLSLKGNLLQRIPVFAFVNSFEKSQHATKLYLSENPWICSCRFMPRILKLCQKYKLIIDQKKIRCQNEKNDPEINGRFLMDLTKTDVCKTKKVLLNNYEIASIIFSVLIVIIAVNFAVDYYRYKYYGKLPWIVLNSPLF